ncbi:MAG TPA: thioesterase family protein [Thermoleophilia bacterium]|nr:thioesterase family protein [Thermoleophilia bacterium]HQG03456.1 thioesterase family protein [Thermoleophilia bacterium]HQG55216.1 thioesterase family protein [Thermoleophilia bacterium]HQJ97225.1 thioesterase family protein [Thermoleophilia bacterium]
MSEPVPTERFSIPVRVRYADTDAAGVCYYANYLAFFEMARVELLRHLGAPIRDAEARGFVFPCVEAHVRYHRPARLDDLLTVELWVTELRRSAFSFGYRVTHDGDLVASGATRHAAVDPVTMRPQRLPDWLLALFDAAPGAVQKAT